MKYPYSGTVPACRWTGRGLTLFPQNSATLRIGQEAPSGRADYNFKTGSYLRLKQRFLSVLGA